MDAGTHATTLGAVARLLETTTLATPTTTQAAVAIASTTTQATMATASTTTQATMEEAAGTVDPLMAIAGVEVATVAAVVEITTKEVPLYRLSLTDHPQVNPLIKSAHHQTTITTTRPSRPTAKITNQPTPTAHHLAAKRTADQGNKISRDHSNKRDLNNIIRETVPSNRIINKGHNSSKDQTKSPRDLSRTIEITSTTTGTISITTTSKMLNRNPTSSVHQPCFVLNGRIATLTGSSLNKLLI